jgi:serine/threonine protein kinase
MPRRSLWSRRKLSPVIFLKLNDWLATLQALHSCGIAHGDIKTENTLVFENNTSTAQNWTAKLSDFGSSILHLNKSTPDGRSHEEFRGTPYYRPPELSSGPRRLPKDQVKSADIWCWGMLVWEVMLNGFEEFYYYHDQDHVLHQIDYVKMDELRQNGDLNQRAVSSIAAVLRQSYHHENDSHQLGSLILGILQSVLENDPIRRPSANEIFRKLDSQSLGRYIPYWNFVLTQILHSQFHWLRLSSHSRAIPPETAGGNSVKELDELPFFDVSH